MRDKTFLKKRLIYLAAIVAGFVIAVGFTTANAKADTKDVTTHMADGTTETHTYTSWDNATALPVLGAAENAEGYYYLTTDVTISTLWQFSANNQKFYLDLNGHTVLNNGSGRFFFLNGKTGCKLVLSNGTFDQNDLAPGMWGGFFYANAQCTFVMDSCTLTNATVNNANNYGGSLHVNNGNAATSVYVYNSTFTDCTGYSGAAASVSIGVLTLEKCTFRGCTGTKNAGAVHSQGASSTLNIIDCAFYDCSGLRGGALLVGEASTANLIQTEGGTLVFGGPTEEEKNKASQFGGNIHVLLGNLNINGGTFYGSTVENAGGNISFFYTTGQSLTIKNATIQDGISTSSSTVHGGGNIAIDHNENKQTGNCTVTLENTIVKNGKAPNGQAGNILIRNGGVTFTMTNGEISGGVAKTHSGNVRCFTADVTLKGTAKVTGGTTTANHGGNMTSTGNITLKDSAEISGGTSASFAGNVYIESAAFTMQDNAKMSGGTASTYGGSLVLAGTGTLEMSGNAELSGGIAGTNGGNLAVTAGGTVTIGGSAKVKDGTAASFGSNISINGKGTLSVTGGQITGGTLTNPSSGRETADIYLGSTAVSATLSGGYYKNVFSEALREFITGGYFIEKPEAVYGSGYAEGTNIFAKGSFHNTDPDDTNEYFYHLIPFADAVYVELFDTFTAESVSDYYPKNHTFTAVAPAHDGHNFTGWSTDNGATVFATDSTVSITTPADGSSIIYYMLYERDGATVSITVTSRVNQQFPSDLYAISTRGGGYYSDGETVTLITTESKKYVKFVGWYRGTRLMSDRAIYSFTVNSSTQDAEYTAVYSFPYSYGDGPDFVDYGEGNYVQVCTYVSEAAYENYRQSLPELGLTKVADNGAGLDGGNVKYEAYTNNVNKFLLHVSYMKQTKVMYVEFSTDTKVSPHLLNGSDWAEDADKYTNTVLVMPALQAAMQSQTAAGNCFIIRLKNGHFIVNDGGNTVETTAFLNYLEDMAQGETPVIEGWFMTHPHGDHYNVLRTILNNASYRNRIIVDGIYFSSPAQSEYSRVDGNLTNYNNIQDIIQKTPQLVNQDGGQAVFYRPYTGQKYYFSDVTVEISLSQDTLPVSMSNYCSSGAIGREADLNDVSLFTMINIEGQKVLIGGDGSHGCARFMRLTYSDSYRSVDVMNMLHHAYNLRQHFVQTGFSVNSTTGAVSASYSNTANLLFPVKTVLYTGTDNINATYAGITTGTNNNLTLEELKQQRCSNVWHSTYRGFLKNFLQKFEEKIDEHFSYSEGTRVLVFPYTVGQSMTYDEWTAKAVVSRSLVLTDNLAVKLYVKLNTGTATLRISLDGGEEETMALPESQDRGYYVFEYRDVTPEKIGDTIVARLVGPDGTEYDRKQFSIRDYLLMLTTNTAAQNGFTGSNASEQQSAITALAFDLLKYAREAQIYKEYKTDALVYDGEGSGRVPTSSVGLGDAYKGTVLKFVSANVIHLNANIMRIRLEVPEGTDFTVKMNGTVVTPEQIGTGNNYYVYSQGLRATEYNDCFTFEAFVGDSTTPDAVLTYSLNTYAEAMYLKENPNNNMQAFAQALYNYGYSASAFAAIR